MQIAISKDDSKLRFQKHHVHVALILIKCFCIAKSNCHCVITSKMCSKQCKTIIILIIINVPFVRKSSNLTMALAMLMMTSRVKIVGMTYKL